MKNQMTYAIPLLRALGASAVERFAEDGFLVIENALDEEQIDALRASFPRLFAGDFDTGVYPDEWYWREGISLPDVTRHMANAWKSDLTVARLALSVDIGRAATELSGRRPRLFRSTKTRRTWIFSIHPRPSPAGWCSIKPIVMQERSNMFGGLIAGR